MAYLWHDCVVYMFQWLILQNCATIAFSVSAGLSSVDLRWSIGALPARKIRLVMRGAEAVYSTATHRDWSNTKRASGAPFLSAAQTFIGVTLCHLATLFILSDCPFVCVCLICVTVLKGTGITCCVYFVAASQRHGC